MMPVMLGALPRQYEEQGANPLVVVVMLAVVVVVIAGMWKVYTKAGQPGWGVLIPIYNVYLMCVIAGRPGWWTILFFIPIVSVIASIIVTYDISRRFGGGIGMMLGLLVLPFIFYPVLGFGSAKYQG